MTGQATPYGALSREIDVTAARATLQRNATPPGHLFIEGVGFLPRVTTILDQLAKPALTKWLQKRDRELYLRAADRIAGKSRLSFGHRLRLEVSRLEDAARCEQTPAALGTAFHSYAEWRSKGMLGLHVGLEPEIPTAVEPAVAAWEDWVSRVGYRPILVEERCWCTDPDCGYTGGVDAVAMVEDQTTLCDWKRAGHIYDTYLLQAASYDHLVTRCTGLVVDRLLIVKLPQLIPGPVETRSVPRAEIPLHYDAFKALLSLWRWSRRTVEDRSDAAASARRQTMTLSMGQASPYQEMQA